MNHRISIMVLGLLMPLWTSCAFTAEYSKSTRPDARPFMCKSIGEISPAHYALEVANVEPPQNPYFIVCPSALNRELAKASDLHGKLIECVPRHRADLMKAADYMDSEKRPKRVAVFKKGEVQFEIGRDPKAFDPNRLNLIWTVPVDIVTGPIQVIFVLVFLPRGMCG